MKINKLILSVISLSSVFAFNLVAQDRVTLKLAHNLDASHVVHQSLESMAKEIQDKSNGEVRVRIYTNGQMGGPRETIEMLQNGSLDLTKASATEMEVFVPELAVFNLPYLFKNQQHFDNVIFGEIGDELLSKSQEKGFQKLASYVAGTRSIYSKKPINTIDELKGMKIRVVSTPTTNKMIESFGASPTVVSFGEVYTALQQGVLDGAENNEPSYVQTRHFEVAPYYIENMHTAVPDYLIISNTALDKLSDKNKEIVLNAAKNSEKVQQDLWYKEVERSRNEAISKGAKFIEMDQTSFRDAVKPMHEEFKADPAKAVWLERINTTSDQ